MPVGRAGLLSPVSNSLRTAGGHNSWASLSRMTGWFGPLPPTHPNPRLLWPENGRETGDRVGERHLTTTLLPVRRWRTGQVRKLEDGAISLTWLTPFVPSGAAHSGPLGHAALAATTSTWRVQAEVSCGVGSSTARFREKHVWPALVWQDGQAGKEGGHWVMTPRCRRGTLERDVAAWDGHRTTGFSRLSPAASTELWEHLSTIEVTGDVPRPGLRWRGHAAVDPGLLSRAARVRLEARQQALWGQRP